MQQSDVEDPNDRPVSEIEEVDQESDEAKTAALIDKFLKLSKIAYSKKIPNFQRWGPVMRPNQRKRRKLARRVR